MRRLWETSLALFLAFLLFSVLGIESLLTIFLEAVAQTLAGWVLFLGRTRPQISWNLDAIATVLVLSTAVLLTSQFVGRTFSPRWSWRWSSVLLGSLLWLFAVTMGSHGLVFATKELASTKEPLIGSNRSADIAMLVEADRFWTGLAVTNGNTSEIWRSEEEIFAKGYLASQLEKYQVIIVPGTEDQRGIVVFLHREPLVRSEKERLAYIDPSGSGRLRPLSDLQSILASDQKPAN